VIKTTVYGQSVTFQRRSVMYAMEMMSVT